MSEREKGFDWKLDGVGLAAFGAGAFLSVLAVLALTRPVPIDGPLGIGGTSGTTTLAALWTGTLGAVPCLLFGALLTVLGARTFLLGETRGTLKGVAVGAGVAFGLAIVLGSFGQAAAWADGGIAGEAFGGTLARRAHPVAGVLLGVLVLSAVAWFAFFRERALEREASEAADASLREVAPKQSKLFRTPLTPMAAAESAEGVTAEEAAALVPDEGHRRQALATALALAREHGAGELPEFDPPPPLPYPEDVRLKGQIPDGARPLGEPQRAYSAQEPVYASNIVRWTPEHGDDADVFADRAVAVAEAERGREQSHVLLSTETEDVDTREADDRVAEEPLGPEPATAELADDVTDERLDELELAADTAAVEPVEEVDPAQAAPPRPSWEQSSLFHEADEPVDAYGTPLSLVETLVDDEEQAEELDEAAELEEDDADELEEAAEFEDGDEEDEEEEEDDEELEEDAELEDGDEEDEEYEEDDEEEQEEAAELEDGDEDAEEEELEEAAELDEEEAVAEGHDKVLIPQPTPTSEHAKRAALVDGPKQRIYEAGCLFLDRGRVAVSMLQREYSLEFDDACTMLDELQELGLIGPYLGGKQRDILLTSDEWLERVNAS